MDAVQKALRLGAPVNAANEPLGLKMFEVYLRKRTGRIHVVSD